MLVLSFPTVESFSVVPTALHILSDPYLICCVNKDLCLIVVKKELRYDCFNCQNNSKCSVRYIFKATKQGAFESDFGAFSVITQKIPKS